MIVVLNSRFDDATSDAVQTLRASYDVASVTVDDLLTAGWVVLTQDPTNATFIAEGRVLAAQNITGVINLMPCIYDFEMLGIRQRDRSYVGAELFAFLVWWLSTLRCPVLNRPTAGCLNGPPWAFAEWARACRRADIPTRERGTGSSGNSFSGQLPLEEMCSTIVVCQRAYGDTYARECVTLAALARTDFLEVFFARGSTGWMFQGVNLLPGIHRPEIRNILTSVLTTGRIEAEYGATVGAARG